MKRGHKWSDYPDVGDGWKTLPKELDLACCDCRLVHSISVRVKMAGKKPRIQWLVERNEEATAALRRHTKRKG